MANPRPLPASGSCVGAIVAACALWWSPNSGTAVATADAAKLELMGSGGRIAFLASASSMVGYLTVGKTSNLNLKQMSVFVRFGQAERVDLSWTPTLMSFSVIP